MSTLNIKIFVLGSLETNSYLVFNDTTKNGFIIDVPDHPARLREFILSEKIKIRFIILTHGHFDHISGLNDFNYKFYIHKKDVPYLSDSGLNGSYFLSQPFIATGRIFTVEDGCVLKFEDSDIRIIHTPGHTPGSICVHLNQWLFSGDTVFAGCVGRTDLAGGSEASLKRSIKDKIMILPPETIVYPGHGRETSIKDEKENNSYFL